MAKKKTFENIISNLLGEPVSNLCHAFYDQYVEANVKFRSRAGMKEVIIRRQLGKCCKWCADLAGIYTPENAPDDIYKRHDNCKCMVTYKDEDGYTDVWSKKEYSKQKRAREERAKLIQEEKIFDNIANERYNASPEKNQINVRVLRRQLEFEYNGIKGFIPVTSIIEEPKVIAGKGKAKVLRLAGELAKKYADYEPNPSEWKKMVGKIRSDKYQFDIHWYECSDRIVREAKIKSIRKTSK